MCIRVYQGLGGLGIRGFTDQGLGVLGSIRDCQGLGCIRVYQGLGIREYQGLGVLGIRDQEYQGVLWTIKDY